MKKLSTGRYQVRWRDRGGSQRAKNFRSREAAQHFERRLHFELESPELAARCELTFAEYATKWLAEHAAITKAETTKAEDKGSIDTHLVPALGQVRLTDLTMGHILELRATLKTKPSRYKRPLAPKTVNNILALAKSMLATAVKLKLIPVNPADDVGPLPEADQAFDFWTAEERDLFVQRCRAIDPGLAELVLVAAHTGLRKSELWALRRSQLDFTTRQIRVDAMTSSRLRVRYARTKNRKVAFVPMSETVYRSLRDRIPNAADRPVFEQHLFVDLRDRFRRRAKAVGSRPIRFHDLRHTCASTLVMAGVPLYTVKAILRHESITSTERYAHLAPAYLREAIEAICTPPARMGSELGVHPTPKQAISNR